MFADPVAGPTQTGHSRADGDVRQVGDLGVGELIDVDQQQHGPKPWFQCGQRVAHVLFEDLIGDDLLRGTDCGTERRAPTVQIPGVRCQVGALSTAGIEMAMRQHLDLGLHMHPEHALPLLKVLGARGALLILDKPGEPGGFFHTRSRLPPAGRVDGACRDMDVPATQHRLGHLGGIAAHPGPRCPPRV